MAESGALVDGSMEASTVGYTLVGCSLGRLCLAGTRRGVCHVGFAETDASDAALLRGMASRLPFATPERDDARLAPWARHLVEVVEGRATRLELPLDVSGTRFQREVWDALRRIPRGETRTYGQIARELGRAGAARAVARACAANPVAVAIPCHRVVPRDGGVGGYAWGSTRKRALLEREGHHVSGKSSGRARAALRP